MTYLSDAAHRLFARQHGVAALNQLVDAGLSRGEIEHLEQRGALSNLIRGVYRTPSAPLTELARSAALCLGRPGVAIASVTAGRIHRFRQLPDDRRIHLIAPPGRKPATAATAVTTYRTAAIHPADIIQRDDGIRVTSRARTALDLSRTVEFDPLGSIIEQAMRDGRLTEDQMRAVAEDWVHRRPWVRCYLNALDQRVAGGASESHPEVVVGQRLSRAGVTGLTRQHRLMLPVYGSVRFDLAVPELRWAIEVDVFPTHEELIGARRDAERDRAAVHAGWTVSRISRLRYERALDAEVEALAALHRRLRQPAS
jgi:very-short-patch-repair endonuclease